MTYTTKKKNVSALMSCIYGWIVYKKIVRVLFN